MVSRKRLRQVAWGKARLRFVGLALLSFLLSLSGAALPAFDPPPLVRAPPVQEAPLPETDAEPVIETAPEQQPAAAAGPSYPRVLNRGQIQFQMDDGALGADKPGERPALNGLAPFPADTWIFVRRLRSTLTVEFDPKLSLTAGANVDPHSWRVQPLDVRFNYKLDEHNLLTAGRFKVPFGWEGLRSSANINTIERSDPTVFLYAERDFGLTLTHKQDNLGEFHLGAFSGHQRGRGDGNGSYDLVGKALVPLGESVKVGVSGHLGTFRRDGSQTDLPVRRLGSELHFKEGPYRLEAEAIWSDGFNRASGKDSRALGYYVQAIYEINDSLHFVLGYDRFDPDLDVVDNKRAANGTNARDRKVIGLNFYPSKNRETRLMLNYEIKQDLEGTPLHNSGVRIRYQVAW